MIIPQERALYYRDTLEAGLMNSVVQLINPVRDLDGYVRYMLDLITWKAYKIDMAVPGSFTAMNQARYFWYGFNRNVLQNDEPLAYATGIAMIQKMKQR